MLGLAMSHATFRMKKLTMTPASGSRMRHFSPSMMAPDMPNAVPIDEKASERWCHALAIMAWLFSLFPSIFVYQKRASLLTMDINAA